MFTYVEGNKFVIDKLGPGTVINSKTFFMEDPMLVYIQAFTNATISTLKQRVVLDIIEKHPKV